MRRHACVLVGLAALAATFPAGEASHTCSSPASSLAAHWAANVESTDALGCHDGTLVNGAAFGPGAVGFAFSFDGRDDYVSIPDSELSTLGTLPFTIQLWAKFNAAPTSIETGPCCVFLGASEGGGNQHKWSFHYSTQDGLTFHVNSRSGGGVFLVGAPFPTASGLPNLGEWYLLKVTRQGNTFAIYVNNVPMGAETMAINVPNPSAPLTIGQIEGLGYFPGWIDEVTILKG